MVFESLSWITHRRRVKSLEQSWSFYTKIPSQDFGGSSSSPNAVAGLMTFHRTFFVKTYKKYCCPYVYWQRLIYFVSFAGPSG